MTRKLQWLQALRGIAAVLVCCFHTKGFLDGELPYGTFLFGHGTIGIGIFFVISGFIMYHTTKDLSSDRVKNVKTFLIKRIIRVAPLYYFLTVLWLLSMGQGAGQPHYSPVDILRTFLFIPFKIFPPVYVGWTLNYEMFFYLLFGLALLLGKRRHLALYLTFFTLVIIVPWITLGEPLNFSNPGNSARPLFDLVTSPWLLQFILGVFVGQVLDRIKLRPGQVRVIVPIALTICVLFYFRVFNFTLASLLICGLLVFATLLLDLSHAPPTVPRILTFLGDASYSFYLVHPFVIAFISGQLEGGYLAWINGSKMVFFLILVLSALCAAVLYELIEKRFTRSLRSIFLKKRSTNTQVPRST